VTFSPCEDEITKRIVRTLDLRLIDIEAQRAERRGISADAMDYVMRGNALDLRTPSKDNCRAMAEMYERALQLDHRLPAALSGMANVLAGRVLDGFSDAREDDLRRAEELVSKALAVDPNNASAHSLKCGILRAQKRFDEAMVEYETVIALNPMNVWVRSHLARAKINNGQPAEAIPLLAQAMKISPRDPFIGYMHYRLGLANLLLGNVDEAIRWYAKAVLTYYEPAEAYRVGGQYADPTSHQLVSRRNDRLAARPARTPRAWLRGAQNIRLRRWQACRIRL
jgi:tetratricopeptide (TPR) repeat protein